MGREVDVNLLAHALGRQSTEVDLKPPSAKKATPSKQDISFEVSRVMAMLGRKGGKVGGPARAANMSKERRQEIALKAARARWDKTATP